MRTKWQILNARREQVAAQYNKIMRELEALEEAQPVVQGCRTCGLPFFTQGDYDRHYLIDDELYLNLGNCPTRYNEGRLMPALHNVWGIEDLWDEAHRINARHDKGLPTKSVVVLDRVPVEKFERTYTDDGMPSVAADMVERLMKGEEL